MPMKDTDFAGLAPIGPAVCTASSQELARAWPASRRAVATLHQLGVKPVAVLADFADPQC